MTKIKLILIALSILAAGGVVAYIYHSGKDVAVQEMEVQQLKNYKKDVEKNEKIDRDVRRMDEPDIDRRLSHWVRG